MATSKCVWVIFGNHKLVIPLQEKIKKYKYCTTLMLKHTKLHIYHITDWTHTHYNKWLYCAVLYFNHPPAEWVDASHSLDGKFPVHKLSHKFLAHVAKFNQGVGTLLPLELQ